MGMKLVWPMVALVTAGLAAVVALILFAPEGRADAPVVAILAMLGTAVTGVFTVSKVNALQAGVTDVQEKVNGRMTQLIDKIPHADRPIDLLPADLPPVPGDVANG